MKEKIKNLAKQIFPKIQAIRHHLHQNPELSFEEHNTCNFIFETLKNIGLLPQKIDTSVIVEIQGKNPHRKTTALRADIDALPITEQNNVPYKSQNIGVMHACGHDVHTSSLLGTAMILEECKNDFEGTVRCIFQMGEERIPGGASLLIKKGVLEKNEKSEKPNNILGQHVFPMLEVGKVGFRTGQYMASADEIYMTIKGKGGHGAMPEQAVDAVLITSHIIIALQQIISRNNSPKMPSVLSFGKVIANGATNILPNDVYVEGTFRTYSETWRKEAHQKIRKIAEGVAEAMGATCELDIKVGYPHLYNDVPLTEKTRTDAEDYLGKENVVDLDLWLAAEDFAYYSQVIPACFYRLGTRNESKNIISGVHTPTFDIDENALEVGAGLMAWLVMKE